MYFSCIQVKPTMNNSSHTQHTMLWSLKSTKPSLKDTCLQKTQKGWGEKSLYSNKTKGVYMIKYRTHDEISVSMHILTFSCSKQYEYLPNFHHDFVKCYSLDRGQNALHNYGTQQGDNSFGAEKQRTHTTVLPL